ncbi:MAG TPA: CBS domain-containing protein [Polyangia bacterium]|nr:CBS domain-containing protein [Polyangia bacterium]
MSDRGPRIADLPVCSIPALPAHLSVTAGRKVAALKQATALAVEIGGRLLGLVDLWALADADGDAELGVVARPIDLVLSPTTSALRARELFLGSGATALPVVAGAFLLGMVSRADVERALRAARLPRRALDTSLRKVA